jgi:DNA gyrase subunit A
MGRVSAGVKGISLRPGDEVAQMLVIRDGYVLTVCENGYGKRTHVREYPTKHRGGMGVIDIRTSDRNGDIVASKIVAETDEVMMITREGQMIRTRVDGISEIGRNTAGVRVISISDGDQVIDITPVIDAAAEDDAAEDAAEDDAAEDAAEDDAAEDAE